MRYLRHCIMICLMCGSAAAQAALISFTGTGNAGGGVGVSASATFDISGDLLTVTLSNTSPSNNGKDTPGSTLTGLFWKSLSGKTLTPLSASLGAGSSIIGTCSTGACGTNLGGEFGYAAQSFTGGANRGIASSGYLTTNLPGDLGNFNGPDIDDPASLDGINFGIISKAPGFKPNGGLDKVPLVSDTMVFVLHGATGLLITDFVNVSFQYGTKLSELNVPADIRVGDNGNVPEPQSVALLGIALLGWRVAQQRKPRHGGKLTGLA